MVSEEDPTLLLPGKEDETKDFVSVQVADKEEVFSKYTKESFEQNEYEEDVDKIIKSFEIR